MTFRFWLVVVVVSVAAGADLYIGLRSGPAPISDAELLDGRRALEARMKRGDVMVHSPLFGVEEVRHLKGLRTLPDLPIEAVRKSRRVLLLDRRDVPMGGFRKPDDRVIVGPNLVLAVFEPKESVEVPLYDLAVDLGPGTMRIERPRGNVVSACREPRTEGGFRCPGQPEWIYVARRRLRIEGQDHECLWAHPVQEGAVVFSIPAIDAPPPGRRLVLELQAALTDEAVQQTPEGATVTTAVVQNRRTLGSLAVPNRRGWRHLSRAVQPGEVVTLVTTTPRDGRRHYCLNARVVDREVPKEVP